MTFPFSQRLTDESVTKKVAHEFAEILKPGDIIALNGNLGSGKTFFVKAACSYFGVENVSSPSFAIVNTYVGKQIINHFDFYRIKKVEELYDIGFSEYLSDDSISFIEWADTFSELLPKSHYLVELSIDSNTDRIIKISLNE